MGVQLKLEVGYKVRFDNMTSHVTRLKFMSDGVLLREVVADPGLQQYSVVILDDAHERSQNMDFLFALTRKVSLHYTCIVIICIFVTSISVYASYYYSYIILYRTFLISGILSFL